MIARDEPHAEGHAPGEILAMPPCKRDNRWAFHVHGCKCKSNGIHRLLSEAEWCAARIIMRVRRVGAS